MRATLGLIQMAMDPDPALNVAAAIHWVRAAAKEGAQIVVLPELFRSQYFCQKEDADLFELAQPLDNEENQRFAALAAELGIVLLLPVFEKRAPGIYHNSMLVIDADGSRAGLYRKMHIPDDPAYYEKYYFTPGDLGFKAFDTRFGKVGTLICWDQWYPEGARTTALLGAQVICCPTAIGWHPYEREEFGTQQRDAWITVQRGHAIASGVYYAAPNRVGFERLVPEQAGIQFWGSSFVCDPQGVMLAQASDDKEEVLLAEMDPGHLEYIRRNWPFLRDRRIDAYGGVTRRYLDEA
ncbi:MAG: acyltransferase [Candidatus Hydrogenedens sp.]|nr:acyltransferase [Candidatus Hydrogenedens sp.]